MDNTTVMYETGRYDYAVGDGSDTVITFKTRSDVFQPTGTSTLMIKSCRKYLSKPKKILDLGCGIGLTGIVLAKLGFCAGPVYGSDICKNAVNLTNENASALGVEFIAKEGSLFEPWTGEKFDVIIDDVSGISEDVAKISPWFPAGVMCDAGKDGARWIVQILEAAPQYLVSGGLFFFPVLSLSDERKILEVAKQSFSNIEMLAEQEWFLPPEITENIDILLPLIDEKIIRCEKKFGAWIWSTKMYVAHDLGKKI